MNPTPTFKQCPQCQHAASIEATLCIHCGHQFSTQFTNPMNQTQLIYGQAQPLAMKDANSKKVTSGICGILLGGLGIHKFVLGYTTSGIIMLAISIVSCGFLAFIPSIIGLIEGIMYLTKSDEQFYYSYIAAKKEWF